MTVALATYSQDTEAMVFAIQFQEALKMADLTIVEPIGRFHASGTPIFLGVIVDMNSKNRELADAIFHAVQKQKKLQSSENTVLFGEGSTMYVPANTKPSDAFILIGAKPIKRLSLRRCAKKNSRKQLPMCRGESPGFFAGREKPDDRKMNSRRGSTTKTRSVLEGRPFVRGTSPEAENLDTLTRATHSLRNAVIGSTADARLAGTRHARAATPSSKREAANRMRGFVEAFSTH